MPPPRRRRRFRAVIKWTGAALCVLFAGLWLVSYRWNISYFEHLHHQLDDDAMAVRLERGALLMSSYDLTARYASVNGTIVWSDGTATAIGSGGIHDTVAIMWDEGLIVKAAMPRTYWRPGVHNVRHFTAIIVPFWLTLAVVAPPTLLLIWLDRRHRYGPHQCPRCGYDLTGNTSGRCPECGTAVASRAKMR